MKERFLIFRLDVGSNGESVPQSAEVDGSQGERPDVEGLSNNLIAKVKDLPLMEEAKARIGNAIVKAREEFGKHRDALRTKLDMAAGIRPFVVHADMVLEAIDIEKYKSGDHEEIARKLAVLGITPDTIRNLQGLTGLEADGKVGPKTIDAIKLILGKELMDKTMDLFIERLVQTSDQELPRIAEETRMTVFGTKGYDRVLGAINKELLNRFSSIMDPQLKDKYKEELGFTYLADNLVDFSDRGLLTGYKMEMAKAENERNQDLVNKLEKAMIDRGILIPGKTREEQDQMV